MSSSWIDGLWTETAKLIGDDTAAGDAFGSAVTTVAEHGTAMGISFDDGANDLGWYGGGYYNHWYYDTEQTASGEGRSLGSGVFESTSYQGQSIYTNIDFATGIDGSFGFRYAFSRGASSSDRIEVYVGGSMVTRLYAGGDYGTSDGLDWRSFEYEAGTGYKNISFALSITLTTPMSSRPKSGSTTSASSAMCPRPSPWARPSRMLAARSTCSKMTAPTGSSSTSSRAPTVVPGASARPSPAHAETLAVGAPERNAGEGAVWMFDNVNDWAQTGLVTAPALDTQAGQHFGAAH
jgi:hypothetical protein